MQRAAVHRRVRAALLHNSAADQGILVPGRSYPAASVTGLAAGGAMAIEPSDSTPCSALALCVLDERVDIPAGVFDVLTGRPEVIGGALTVSPVVRRPSVTGKTRVKEALADLQRAGHDQAPGTLFKAATRFYALIFEGARHNIAWEIVQRLNGRISRLRVLTLTSDDRDRQGPEHMQAICNAITNSDPEAALAAVKAHLNEVKTIARHLLPGNAKE
ncbi:aldehyde dehydrogenase family protein [Salipiger sp. HF18]|uniref:aldehyde dehydrogenase family protein n=1 Tax=Salipiger sp. HF18 TaxID=2721557 RepID=UPI0026DA882F|nr:aldehyde dehydrogenase family protein [Salipiger sp. HF18]